MLILSFFIELVAMKVNISWLTASVSTCIATISTVLGGKAIAASLCVNRDTIEYCLKMIMKVLI